VGLEEELFEVGARNCGIYDSPRLAVAAFAFFVFFFDRREACMMSLCHHDGRDLDAVLPLLRFAKFRGYPFDSTDFGLNHLGVLAFAHTLARALRADPFGSATL
jgi:hypothetical protein